MPPSSDETSAIHSESVRDVPAITGNVDGFNDFSIAGWAYDKSRREERLPIDVVDEHGRVLAQGRADIFRVDLLLAGIADGQCSFSIPLPASLADGMPHRLRALVADTGDAIPGEIEVQRATTVFGEIDGLDGRFVIGWASDRAAPGMPVAVELVEAGRLLATAVADRTEAGRSSRFRFALPDECLDGRPHAFVVRVARTGQTIAGAAMVAPSATPSIGAFQRSAVASIHASVDPRARYRYESLARQLSSLVEGTRLPDWAERLAVLKVAHHEVVRGFERRRTGEDPPPLSFPAVDSPRVSIVIPVHDQLPVTYHCLASLLLAPNRASFEVIVVDDGSTDDTPRLTRIVKGITYLRNEGPNGFVHASNLGASKARGEYVVMLNNDCEVTAGWLDALLDVFERFENVGLAGAKLLYPDGRLQEAGGLVWGNGDAWNYGRNGNAADPRYNYVRQMDYASGACVMLPKALWDSVGGFDERYAPAYYEDADLCFRIRENGYKTVYSPFCEVFHFEGLSGGTNVSAGTKRFQKVNEPKFKARWAQAYRAHARVGREPADLAKDRGVTLRALVIDAETPQPDRDAGSYAVMQEMRLLQSLGFKVTFVPENALHLGGYTEALQRMGVECLFAPFVSSPCDVLQARGGEFDLVYVARYYVAASLIDAARRHAPQARVVLNNIDLHFLREMRAALSRNDPDGLKRSLRTRDDELSVMRKVDLVLSYNHVEHAVILSHNVDSTRVAACPWVVSLPERVVPGDRRADIAFLGGFQHQPNVEAVEHFVRTVMPLLRERLPSVRFLVYGSHVPRSLEELRSDDVVMKGYVPSVEQVYESCRVFVAPLLSGAGLKGKVVGALAHGVPCVLSSVAAEGIRVRDGEEAFLADSPEDWVSAIAALYEDEPRWTRMSRAARALAAREYSFEKGRAMMENALHAAGLFGATNDSASLSLVAKSVRN